MHTNTVIIGAGHAGLALSRSLTDRGVEHVVLERGRLGERWRSARWDSFRLLTPAWMMRLPGQTYDGDRPDSFLTVPELLSYLGDYARSFDAPVHEMTTVTRVSHSRSGYRVTTDRGVWRCSNVVIATGYHSRPIVPAVAAGLPREVVQVNPATYRRPHQLPDGGVLVVGASSSGVQIADELVESGREVVLAVGSHTRLPRRYRGHDILWWLDRIGSLDRTIDEYPDPVAAQREPSLQLAGSERPVDLGALHARGVRVAGRLIAAAAGEVRFADDLVATTTVAAVTPERGAGQHRSVRGEPPPGRRSGDNRVTHRRTLRADPAEPGPDRNPHRRVGDRLPTDVPMAERAGAGRHRTHPPSPGNHRGPRSLRDRPAVPAPTQRHVPRRRPPRRRPPRRPHRRPHGQPPRRPTIARMRAALPAPPTE